MITTTVKFCPFCGTEIAPITVSFKPGDTMDDLFIACCIVEKRNREQQQLAVKE